MNFKLTKILVTGCAGFIGSKITELLLEHGDIVVGADHEGFRCGICLPFKPYDVIEDRVI